jgi:hypothetical protein
VANGRERSIAFWFEFDNFFNPGFGQVPDEVFAAYAAMPSLDFPLERWREHRLLGTYPDGFRDDMTSIREPLLFLSTRQVELLDRHFAGDPDGECTAFEEFGQGVLFDDRRPPGEKLHKMDIGGPDDPPIGYHRWHGIIRAAVMVGTDADRWLQINRHVGLAWAIQSEARPVEDAPDNPGLPAERLDQLRPTWKAFSFDQLDTAFDSDPFPPGVGVPAGLEPRAAGTRARSGFDQLRTMRRPGSGDPQSG